MIARKRSQYSRFFIFAAAAALLVSGVISSRLESTFQLFAEKSGIYADFSTIFRAIYSKVKTIDVDPSELKSEDYKLEKKISEARTTALSESPILISIKDVREIYGPDPYRWVRVRFDQKQRVITAARAAQAWALFSHKQKSPPQKQTLFRGEIKNLNHEAESMRLARLHDQIKARMSTHDLNTQRVRSKNQNEISSIIQSAGDLEKEARLETAPVVSEVKKPILPVQIVSENEGLNVSSQVETETVTLTPTEQALVKPDIVVSTGLDEVPPLATQNKPSVVKKIHDRLVNLLAKTEIKAGIKNETVIHYEPVAESQSHLEDLDTHIQTIEYSDLPAITSATQTLKEEVVAAATQERVIAKETTVITADQNSTEQATVEVEVPTEEKTPDSGPVLVSGFNSTIQVSQSSMSTRPLGITELIQKVNRLREPSVSRVVQEKPKSPVPEVEPQEKTADVRKTALPKVAPKTENNTDNSAPEEKSADEIYTTQSAPADAVEIKKTCDTALIGQEAFSTGSSPADLISVCRRVLSLEGSLSGTGSRWWEVRESVNHWPTVIRQKPESALKKNDRIPVLSLNTVKILSTLSKAQAQSKSAGIIVGEVPPGIQVSLSGRSEPIIYFNSRLQILNSQDTKTTRFFTFLNVEPGLPLLNVTLKSGNGAGTIALMVQSGAATYVRVPSPRLRKVTGTVYSANSVKPLAVIKANVQVVGQSGKQAVTDKRGNFELNNVLTFDDHPLFLDVSSGSREFRHRYRVLPESSKDVALFRFEADQVSHWVQQLEGGVSPMSGLIAGALPGLLNVKQAKPGFEVKIGTLDRKSILRPEVYGLGSADTLLDTNQIRENATRFLSVQVPEGPNVPSAFDSHGNMIWSEIVYAQPGVINVVVQ